MNNKSPGIPTHSVVEIKLFFKLYSRQSVIGTRSPIFVVKNLFEVEHVAARFSPRRVNLTLEPLPFEQLEEALGNSVVMALPSPALATAQVVGSEEALPCVTGKLAPLIRVLQYRLLWYPAPDRHQQRVYGQVCCHS